jgi:hypothetical protein
MDGSLTFTDSVIASLNLLFIFMKKHFYFYEIALGLPRVRRGKLFLFT